MGKQINAWVRCDGDDPADEWGECLSMFDGPVSVEDEDDREAIARAALTLLKEQGWHIVDLEAGSRAFAYCPKHGAR